MRNKSIYALTFILFVIGFVSCENPKPKNSEILMNKAFTQKIEAFKVNKRKDCLNGIMVDAEALVDSIIAEQLNLDTIDFPRKPIKPSSPDIKNISEEFELVPIK